MTRSICCLSAAAFLLLPVGCGKQKVEEQEKESRIAYVLPPPRLPKYRHPDTNPQFGRPYHYGYAVSGNVPELPGSRLARSGVLVDLDTRQVLWEKDSRTPTPIASLTKLMTIYLVMELLEQVDKPDLDSLVTVSQESCSAAPVKAGLRPGEKIPLRNLLGALMLRSANDAAHQIAEYFGDGDADNFINRMNSAARDIGIPSAAFYNPNGLPIYRKDAETLMNLCSPHDMVLIAERAMEFPLVLELTSAQSIAFRPGVSFNNTNHLLSTYAGADGLKTGYTGAAGHCLAFSSVRNGRRLVGVVTGFQKRPDCFEFSRQLLDWGYSRPKPPAGGVNAPLPQESGI
jgi:D-alanyl-D-alanine carboxypeptidase (penicillin-binding protein 5/6)